MTPAERALCDAARRGATPATVLHLAAAVADEAGETEPRTREAIKRDIITMVVDNENLTTANCNRLRAELLEAKGPQFAHDADGRWCAASMHPTGRCTCAGKGVCKWCVRQLKVHDESPPPGST